MRIITIGTPLPDFVIHVSKEYLAENVGPKESYVTIKELAVFQERVKNLPSIPVESSGGSALNTSKGLQGLGENECIHLGVIGSDTVGHDLEENLRKRGIISVLQKIEGDTGRIIGYVTPGGNRTFCYFPGVSDAMADLDLNPALFKGADLVHMDGYTLLFPELCERVITIAKEHGVAVSFNMPSYTLVEAKKPELQKLLKRVDLLIGNKLEAQTFTGKEPREACLELQKICPTVVVTTGKKGGWVADKEGIDSFEAVPTEVVDTLGAGDYFTAGFAHAWLRKKPKKECAHLGAKLAAEVIKIVGADLSPDKVKSVL